MTIFPVSSILVPLWVGFLNVERRLWQGPAYYQALKTPANVKQLLGRKSWLLEQPCARPELNASSWIVSVTIPLLHLGFTFLCGIVLVILSSLEIVLLSYLMENVEAYRKFLGVPSHLHLLIFYHVPSRAAGLSYLFNVVLCLESSLSWHNS